MNIREKIRELKIMNQIKDNQTTKGRRKKILKYYKIKYVEINKVDRNINLDKHYHIV